MRLKNYYSVLGVSSNASQDEIKAAYRKLVRQFHPDRNFGKEDHFKLIQEAYEVLSDEKSRDTFDAQLAYETYTSDPIELAKFLKDQKNKPKKYKPPLEDDEEQPEPAKKLVFNSTSVIIMGIVAVVVLVNVFVITNRFSSGSIDEVKTKNVAVIPASEMNDEQRTQEYAKKARNYFNAHNFEFALMYYKKAMEHSPRDPNLFFNRGLVYYVTRDYQAALNDFNHTLKIDSQFKNAYWVRAKLKYDMDDNTGAIDDFTEAIKRDPSNDSLYFNRGLAHYYLKNFDAAIQDIDKAIELNPKQAQYYFDRGDAKEMIGDEDGTCNDWSKARELGFQSSQYKKKRCIGQEM